MKIEKIINYKHIGDVLYRKNSRAKNISIRINSKAEIKVTVPAWVTYHRAEQFVLEKEAWIIKKAHTIKRRTNENLVWRVGDKVDFLYGSIALVQGSGDTIEELQVGKNYIVELPSLYDPGNQDWREKLLEKLGDIGMREAKQYLPKELERLAQAKNLKYTKLSIRRMRTRWGSCSSKDNISLNSGLVFLPRELMEYVILHELVHTIHKNHSAAFWNALVEIMPDALECRKSLHGETIIA
ncbi:MAG: SprT family zinc-dependent metalloprotease [Bacteroidales bacterium]|jgi:predicted metal-dependent hydrolase|nr:SprT family zinc-dependent metalloprotease [Bacteroidales bacterium]